MLSGTREKDTRKERSSSPCEARSAPDRASARSGRDATVLTGSDVAPASIGKEHSASRSAALLLLVQRGSRPTWIRASASASWEVSLCRRSSLL